jgi:hydroxyacylglutathione hydrolase
VYPAHEYTLSNLRFAQAADPDNPAVADRIVRDQASLARGEPTLPSSIGEEKLTNPFLRAQLPELRRQAEAHAAANLGNDPVAVFTTLRGWKNQF